jgi:predicted secreted hydrolase
MLRAAASPTPTACGLDASDQSTKETQRSGFAYDPEAEEGPHPKSDFEWWYHFGFLKQEDAPKYEYSVVSSFQRNAKGRDLFYNLCDL